MPGRENSELSGAALSGSFWLTAARWTDRIGNILGFVLLARFLGPAEFGLVASTLVVIGFLNLIGPLGLLTAATQRLDPSDRLIYTAWTYDTVLMKGVAAVALFFSAPLAASLFGEPELTSIVQVLALTPLVQVFENEAMMRVTHELNYRRHFFLVSAKGIGFVVVLIPVVLLWQSAWAFVYATIAGRVARVGASYAVYPHLPRISFDPEAFKELFGFGKWILGLHVARILQNQADRIILGGMLGSTALGIYQVGSKPSIKAFQDLYTTTHKILWPIYSKLQEDINRMRRSFGHVLQLIGFISLPAAGVLFVLAPEFVAVVFGPEWEEAVPLMRVLLGAGVLRTLTWTGYPLFRGGGKPSFEFAQYLVYLGIQVPLLLIGIQFYGLSGAAAAMLLTEVLLVPVWLWLLNRKVQVTLAAVVAKLLGPVAVAALATFAAFIVQFFGSNVGVNVLLAAEVVVAGITYLGAIYCAVRYGQNRSLNLLFGHLSRKINRYI